MFSNTGLESLSEIKGLKQLSSFIRNATLWLGEDGVILAGNDRLANDLGYNQKELQGKRITELFPGFSIIYWKKLWRLLVENKNMELGGELMTSEDIIYPVSINATYFPTSKDGLILLIVKDQLESERFKDLLEISSKITKSGSWEWNLLKDELAYTENLTSLLGVEEKSLKSPKSLFSILYKSLAKEAFKSLKNNLKNAIQQAKGFESELTIRDSHGQFNRFFLKADVFEFEDTVSKVYGAIQDLSDIEERTEDLYLAEFSLENTPEMVYWVNRKAEFVYANKACSEKMGFSQKEILQKKITDINPTYDPDTWKLNWDAFIEKPSGQYITKHQNRKGDIYPVEITYTAVQYKGEQYAIGFVRDISKKMQKEETLELSSFTMNHNPDMIFWIDENSKIKYFNDPVLDNLGYTSEELLKLTVSDFDSEYSKENFDAIWKSIRKEGRASFTSTHRKKDGSFYPTDVEAFFLTYKDEDYLVCYVKNIKDSIKEKELKELSAITLEEDKNMIYWVLPDSTIRFCNQSAIDRLGYAKEELEGMSITSIAVDYSKEDFDTSLKIVKEQGQRIFRVLHKAKTGEVFPVEIKSKYVSFKNVELLVVYVEDITQKEAAEAIRDISVFTSDNSTEMIFWLKQDGAIKYVNQTAVDKLGYSKAELLSMSVYDLDPTEKGYFEENWNSHKRRIGESFETNHLMKSGALLPVEIRSYLHEYKNESYHISYVQDSSDVSESWELKLLSTTTLEYSSSILIWTNKEGGILFMNKAAREKLGYTSGYKNKLQIFQIEKNLTRSQFRKNCKLVKKERKFSYESQFIDHNNLTFPVEVKIESVQHREASYYLYFVEDLTESIFAREWMQIGSFTIDNATDLILWSDPSGRIQYANDIALKRLKYKLEDIKKMHLLDLGGDVYDESEFERITDIIQEKGIYEFESTYQTRKGKQFPVEISAKKIKYKNSEYLVSFVQDITKKKDRERTLNVAKLTIDQSIEMVFWIKEDGYIDFANESAIERFAHSYQELLEKPSFDISPIFDAEMWPSHWQKLIEQGTMSFEAMCKDKFGTLFPTEFILQYTELDGVPYNIATVRDVSERKAIEKSLVRNQFAVNNSRSLIIWTNLDAQLIFANQTAQDYLGIVKDKIQNLSLEQILIDFDEELWEKWLHQLKEGTFELEENLLRRKKRGPCPISLSANYIAIPEQPLSIALFINDISALKRKSIELEIALDELNAIKNEITEEKIYLEEELSSHHNFNDIISASPNYKKVLKQIEQVATTDATVLIHGETGTGKELLARAVHGFSNRSEKALVKVNCAALPENLIESELFGHEKGAFTGAYERKIGRFELANKGTIFLDEIGEMPIELQSKLLRVLQEGEFERLGNSASIKVDVRVIVATNRRLEEMVEEGRFRQDLYYRLNVFPIHNIPLRERLEDIPFLLQHFMKKYCEKIGKPIPTIVQSDLDWLLRYHFPGNIRELENIIERAVIISDDGKMNLKKVLPELTKASFKTTKDQRFKTLVEAQREHIVSALKLRNWKISGVNSAAELLDINGKTLASRMKKLGIEKP